MARPEGGTARRLVTILYELLDVDDLEEVLRRVLGAAQELTGARYAALGLLNEERDALARFLTVGLDEDERQVIGDLPRGRGVLGELIEYPQILRLADLARHPHSYGFPPGHPGMKTFLGGPIVIRGEIYGNIYLTEKVGGAEFDEADEELLLVLTEYAAIGIHHARRLDQLESRRDELDRTVAALGATSEISRALAGEVDLGPILELVAKRGRALVDARALVILLPAHDGLRVAHAAGELPEHLVGQTVDESSLAGLLGLEVDSGLHVPLAFRGRRVGMLVALDRLMGGPEFSAADEQLLRPSRRLRRSRSAPHKPGRDAPARADRCRRSRAPPLGAGAARRDVAGRRRRPRDARVVASRTTPNCGQLSHGRGRPPG